MKRIVCGLWLALLVPAGAFAAANEAAEVSSADEIFDQLREERNPESGGDSAADILDEFFKGGEVDDPDYPPSEIWDHDFNVYALAKQRPAEASYSGRFFTRFSDDNISGVEKWEKEFELNLGYKDIDGYFRASDYNSFAYNNDPFRLEKARARYKHDTGKVTVGSFGALFGRGLVLNMYEDSLLDFDNELEGIKVEQEVGDDVEVTALWGTRKLRSEVSDSEVSGARVQSKLGDHVTVGLSTAKIELPGADATADTPNKVSYDVTGGDITIRGGEFTFYTEYAQQDLQESDFLPNNAFSSTEDGRALYAALGYNTAGFSVLAEYKNYRSFLQPFSVLPPLQEWFELATANPADDVGYAFEANWSPASDGSSWNARYAQANLHDGGLPFSEFGLVYTSPSQERETTWIGEYWDVNKQGQFHNLQRLTLHHVLDEDYTASGSIERERIDPGFGDLYTDWIYTAEMSLRSDAQVVFLMENTGDDTGDQPSNWKVWEFKYRPDDVQEINVVAGSRREGFICSGGICRLEPAFDGLKVDYLLRF